MTDRIRWGIISTAHIGLNRVIPAIQASRNGVVLGIASRDSEKARATAQKVGIERAYGSYETLLADPDIDAIYNPLPNDGHKPWTIAALKAGKAVLVEKPIACTAADAREMVEVAHSTEKLLAEGFMYRYHNQYAILQGVLNSKVIGRLTLLNLSFTYSLEPDKTDTIKLKADLGGGGLLDVGCYCVNLCRMIIGTEPEAVSAFAAYGPSGVDETLVGTLRFPGDILAHLDCGMRAHVHDQAIISGTEGMITMLRPFRYSPDQGEIHLQLRNGADEALIVNPQDEYQLMVEDFGDSLQQGRPVTHDPTDSIKNMIVLDALAQSAREGKTVYLDK